MAEPAKRILVIEDDIDVYEVLQIVLEAEKYQVTLAKNGVEGLRLVKEWKPDLVVLDLMIPRMDGFKVLESARLLNLSPAVKVLVLTALGQVAYVDKAMALGADGYITKPFDMQKFLAKVRRLLDGHQA